MKEQGCKICIPKAKPEGVWGYYYADDNNGAIIECECHKTWKRVLKVDFLRSHSSIPETEFSVLDASWTNKTESINNIIKLVDNFSYDSPLKSLPMYLYGPPNSGKTLSLYWIGNSLLDKGFSVKYSQYLSFLSDICPTSYEKDDMSLSKTNVSKYLSVDVLMIDRCFEQLQSPLNNWQIYQLESFLERRIHQEKKCTILSSRQLPTSTKKGYESYESVFSLILSETKKNKSQLLMPLLEEEVNTSDIWSKLDAKKR